MNVTRRRGLSKGRLIGLSMLFLAGATLRCSENPVPKRSDPCSSVYAGQCGSVCTTDTECPSGLHCDAGKCTATCGGDVSLCGGGQSCTSSGRCQGPTGSAGMGPLLGIDASPNDDAQTVFVDGDACNDTDLMLGEVTPTVVLLIDQSASMEDTELQPNLNRWQALKAALTGAGSVIQSLQDRVRFGFAFYSNDPNNNPGAVEGVCPTVDKGGLVMPLMPPALNNFTPFNTYFTPLPTWLNTPTAESFEAVAAELSTFAEPGPKYIVIATDGEPDRCDEPEEDTDELSRAMVVDNVENAYQTLNISTFVISVGDDVAATHLNDVANVGQGFQVDDPMDRFFLVTSQDALKTAFETIITGVRSCTMSLNGVIDPALAASGTVTIDGMPLPLDPVNGWSAGTDGRTIILNGTACDLVKTNAQFISAKFPCEAILEPPK